MTRLSILLGALLLAACATAPAPPVAAPASKAPVAPSAVPADDNLNGVAWMQTAIEHDLICREIYRDAQERLLAALHDPHWDALPHDERHDPVENLKPAVVLDVDETVLDNSPYQARLVRSGGEYNDPDWSAWVKEEAATALPGALEFTRFAAAHGIAVIYISNRDHALDQATLDNLRKQGFPVSGPEALLGLGAVVPGCKQHGTDKSCRRRKIGADYRVLMQIGDQIGDFIAVPTNTLEGRRQLMQPYLGWIGERWFVLPNVTYGSWEPALFNNDWALPREERRRAKLGALRY